MRIHPTINVLAAATALATLSATLPATATASQLHNGIRVSGSAAASGIASSPTASNAHAAWRNTDGQCPANYICFWENKYFTGKRIAFPSANSGLYRSVNRWNYNDVMSSWTNNSRSGARWYWDVNGGSQSRYMAPRSSNGEVGKGWLNRDDDNMSSFMICRSVSC